MKLPKEYNLYSHNHYLEKLALITTQLSKPHNDEPSVAQLILSNHTELKKISALVAHLELVLDEAMKLYDEGDDYQKL